MAESFPLAPKGERGYNIEQVEKFLGEAREAFTSAADVPHDFTSENIRTSAFSLSKRGYQITAVDEALERLERVFYERERAQKIAALGSRGWREMILEQRNEVLERLARPNGQKFQRAGFLKQGYERAGVDRFADLIIGHFQNEQRLTADQVRQIAFVPQANGYRELQVDALLDRVIELILDEELA